MIIKVRIVSELLAEMSGMKVGAIHEAWVLGDEHDAVDDDGNLYAYNVWDYADCEQAGDPPVCWYAHADDVEVVE